LNGNIELTDTEIIIRVPIGALKYAVEIACDNEFVYGRHNYTVSDSKEALKSLYYELCKEKEDGTTLVDRMLDKAVIGCIEDGAEGIDGGIIDYRIPTHKECI